MRSSRTATAGVILAASLSAATVGLAGAASAAPAAPRPQAATVSRTWTAAQRSARFGLVKPTRTEGLPRNGFVRVAPCMAPGRSAPRQDRVVTATYRRGAAGPLARTIIVEQANAPRVPCPYVSGRGFGKFIGRVRVDGATATLTRPGVYVACNSRTKCSAPVELQLQWVRHGHDYQITSVGGSQAQLIGFARGLVPVR